MALLKEVSVVLGVAQTHSHALVPVIGDVSEAWIKGRSKTADQTWQWVFEVTILTFAKAMSRHVNVASKATFVVVKPSDLSAFFWRKKLFHYGAAITAEFL